MIPRARQQRSAVSLRGLVSLGLLALATVLAGCGTGGGGGADAALEAGGDAAPDVVPADGSGGDTAPGDGAAELGPPDLGAPDATPEVAPDLAAPDAAPDGTPDGGAPDGGAPDAPAPDAAGGDTADAGGGDATVPPQNPDCDPLQQSACALPWPSNLYLEPDAARVTGYTLRFGATTLPKNFRGNYLAPEPYARLDGYGIGGPLLVHFPNLDAAALPDENHVAESLLPDAAILWFQVTPDGLERVPYWAELDSWEPDAAKKTLFVRPAVILPPATRFIVAFRDLADTAGVPFEPSPAFAALVAGTTAGDAQLAPRQARFDDVFTHLEEAGIPRDALLLAWDFVTASSEALHGPMLAMRDDAFAVLDPAGPELTVTEVTEFLPADDGSGRPVNENIALEIEGTFHVPHYMEPWVHANAEGFVFHRGADGLPAQNGWRDPQFWVRIPHSALTGRPHGLVQYGHGLLGEATEVRAGYNGRIANQNDLIFFACKLVGMADEDYGRTMMAVTDMNLFPWLADRLHQGMLEYLLLARAMRERLAELPEVVERGIVVNPAELFYSGISQGGIFGGTYMALSTDVTRGHLGVPGNNYSTLLHRSTDFEEFFQLMAMAYRPRVDQAIVLSAVQLLWDGTDPVSYLPHVAVNPLPNTPTHQILVVPAIGDYQVAVVTNEVLARSNVGVPLAANWGRPVDLVAEVPYPLAGSGIVSYAFGNPWPAPGNRPPPDDEWGDPHERPRRQDHHTVQMVTFFRTGEIVDVCGGDGCTPD